MKIIKKYKEFLNEKLILEGYDFYNEFYINRKDIDEYFFKNYKWSDYYNIEDALDFFSWENIVKSIDEDALTKVVKNDILQYYDVEEYEHNYVEYFNENKDKLEDDVNWKFKSEYLIDMSDEDKKEYEDYTYEQKVEELYDYSASILGDIIDEENHTDFLDYSWEKRESTGYEYYEDIYGEPRPRSAFKGYNRHKDYLEEVKPLFDLIKKFIDEDKLNEIHNAGESDEYKVEYYFGQIYDDDEDDINDSPQKKLVDYDIKNAERLFTNDDVSSGKYMETTEYQEKLIISYLMFELDKEKIKDDLSDIDEKTLKEYLPDLFNDMDEKIGVNEKIKKKYSKYMIKVRTKDFNL